jgi:hypothetical protein
MIIISESSSWRDSLGPSFSFEETPHRILIYNKFSTTFAYSVKKIRRIIRFLNPRKYVAPHILSPGNTTSAKMDLKEYLGEFETKRENNLEYNVHIVVDKREVF